MSRNEKFCHIFLLVVVDDFNIHCLAATPSKANSVLVVDTDAVLAFSVATESFKPVARRCAEIVQCCGEVQSVQLTNRNR